VARISSIIPAQLSLLSLPLSKGKDGGEVAKIGFTSLSIFTCGYEVF
jgi:hypothetical protein